MGAAEETHPGWGTEVEPVSQLSSLESPLKAFKVFTVQNDLFIRHNSTSQWTGPLPASPVLIGGVDYWLRPQM